MSEHLQSGQHPDADQISAFVDRALPVHEREEMLAHLAECADCRETVALSLPAIENAPVAAGEKKSKTWSWGLRLLWPATAAALTIVLYLHYASKHNAVGRPGPEVALERPAAPAEAKNAPMGGAGGGAGSYSAAGRAAETPGRAPRAQAGAIRKEQGAEAGNRLAADSMRREGEWHLPGGARTVSAVRRGMQVLAIDDRNRVFLSKDGGGSWIAVQAPWKGRVIKAELVSYPVAAAALGRLGGEANPGVVREKENATDAEQFRAQKSLRQELKGSYKAPMNGAGDAPSASAQVLTAPATNGPAGSQGVLSGVVTDRTGAVISGAAVTVTNTANHASRTAVTGADGRYRIDGLGTGTYQMEASARGFNVTRLSGLEIDGSSSNMTDMTLEVGAAAQTVTVQSAAPELEPRLPELATNAISPKHKSAPSVALIGPAPVFEVTTDTGDHWISADGANWHRQ